MATSTAVGYNTGSTITGTQQIGSLAVVTGSTANPSSSPNGVTFWMGPNEDLGYVIAHPTTAGNQPNPVGGSAYVGFWRSAALTENSFINLSQYVSNNTQTFTNGNNAETWLNANGYWSSWTGATSVLIGYYSNPGTFINDCSAAFTGVTTTLPLYVPYVVSGVTYTLGQLMSDSVYAGGTGPNIFYSNDNLATPLPSVGGTIYGFSPTSGGTPYRQFRLASSTSYTGWARCGVVIANGYMVQSSTLVNVGNSQRDYMVPDDTSVPYVGKEIYSSSGTAGFGAGQTWAWASQPNVIATNLITFGSSNTCLTGVT